MKTRIESTIRGQAVMFRMVCKECGRVGIYHKDLDIAERTASLHEKHAHAQKAAA